jgi:hypothetical protein
MVALAHFKMSVSEIVFTKTIFQTNRGSSQQTGEHTFPLRISPEFPF